LLKCYDLWLVFGTGKQFRYIPAHEIANIIGPEKAQALPMFHAITGCDTFSSFFGHGKEAWSTWNALPELTPALVTLSHAPREPTEDTLHIIQRFVILLYDRRINIWTLTKLFAKRTAVKHIRCSRTACKESYLSGRLCMGTVADSRA